MDDHTTYTSTAGEGPGLTVADLTALYEKLRQVVICTAIWFIDSPVAYYRMHNLIRFAPGDLDLDRHICPRIEGIPVYTWESRLWAEGDPEPPTREVGVWALMSDGSKKLLGGW